jgi:hypothetical protein
MAKSLRLLCVQMSVKFGQLCVKHTHTHARLRVTLFNDDTWLPVIKTPCHDIPFDLNPLIQTLYICMALVNI